jgi:hypothetical protein
MWISERARSIGPRISFTKLKPPINIFHVAINPISPEDTGRHPLGHIE